MSHGAPESSVRAEESKPLTPGDVPAASPPATHPASPPAAQSHRLPSRRTLLIGGGFLILFIGLCTGMPWLDRALNTVSTDDAYVSDYVTFVAPRVSGQVVAGSCR